jgi:hypothetical protein
MARFYWIWLKTEWEPWLWKQQSIPERKTHPFRIHHKTSGTIGKNQLQPHHSTSHNHNSLQRTESNQENQTIGMTDNNERTESNQVDETNKTKQRENVRITPSNFQWLFTFLNLTTTQQTLTPITIKMAKENPDTTNRTKIDFEYSENFYKHLQNIKLMARIHNVTQTDQNNLHFDLDDGTGNIKGNFLTTTEMTKIIESK